MILLYVNKWSLAHLKICPKLFLYKFYIQYKHDLQLNNLQELRRQTTNQPISER